VQGIAHDLFLFEWLMLGPAHLRLVTCSMCLSPYGPTVMPITQQIHGLLRGSTPMVPVARESDHRYNQAMSDFQIRVMRPDEISTAVDWAATEGWNPGLADASCFAVADPQGFLIGELDGSPAATVSCVNYGAS